MREIIAAIRAVLGAVASIVWVTCKRTGKLIMKLVPDIGGSAPAPARLPVRSGAVGEKRTGATAPTPRSTSTEVVRELARAMAAGTAKPADMKGVSTAVVQWLGTLDRVQLCRLVCAKDLNEYLAGRDTLKDMPPYLEVPEPRPAQRRTAEPDFDYRPRLAYPI